MKYWIVECQKCGASVAVPLSFVRALTNLLSWHALYTFERMVGCCKEPLMLYEAIGTVEL